MKINGRKLLALVLTVCLCASLTAGLSVFAGAEESVIEVNSAKQLQNIADEVNGGDNYSGKTILLKDNITISNWTPIGCMVEKNMRKFAGTFDGQGHTVTITYQSTSNFAGLIGGLSGTVKNVVVAGNVSGGESTGGVVGRAYSGAVIQNCSNIAEISGTKNVGGIAGYLESGCTISNCFNTGTVESKNNGYVGGIAGTCCSNISGCINQGEVKDSANNGYIGGLAGSSGGYNVSLTGCYNKGSISSTSTNIGQYFGYYGKGSHTETNCFDSDATDIIVAAYDSANKSAEIATAANVAKEGCQIVIAQVTLPGDTNGDGKISAGDASALLDAADATGTPTSTLIAAAAGITGTGFADKASRLMQYLVGKVDTL